MPEQTARITGSFLDEITWDIGSQNWSFDDWRVCFDAMEFIGIDTVIIIRGGLRDQAVFPSEVIGNSGDPDLAQLFLDEAAKHKMRLFFGNYDSGKLYSGGGIQVEDEFGINRRFVDEVWSRYGDHPAWGGWYETHEVCENYPGANELFKRMANYLKAKTPRLPILISPYYPSKMLMGEHGKTPKEFGESWRQLLSGLSGLIDIMAFQDGTAALPELGEYMAEAKSFGDELGIEFWNNTETFERGLSYNFPPRDVRMLRRRLDIAGKYVTKTITFEFSHFMSPNSSFPGAANLYRRYCETALGKESPY